MKKRKKKKIFARGGVTDPIKKLPKEILRNPVGKYVNMLKTNIDPKKLYPLPATDSKKFRGILGEKKANEANDAFSFTTKYLNSPAYKKKLENFRSPEEAEVLKNKAIEDNNNLYFTPAQSRSGKSGALGISNEELKKIGFNKKANVVVDYLKRNDPLNKEYSSVITHEADHVTQNNITSNLNTPIRDTTPETKELLNRSSVLKEYNLEDSQKETYKNYTPHQIHDIRPTEIHADMQAVRKFMQDKGLNNVFEGEEVTSDTIKNIKNSENIPSTVNRFFDNIKSEEDALYLLNKVAENKNNTSDINYAAKGGNLFNMKKRVKKIPKYYIGALISAGTSIYGAIQGQKHNKMQQAQQAQLLHQQRKIQGLQDEQAYADYEKSGNLNVEYYGAKGMKLPPSYTTTGGDLLPLSSNTVVAKGNKHEESIIDNTSGIKLMKGGEPFAEIEDDEVIKNNTMVYSDRTKVDGKNTYADIAKKLGREKGKIEKTIGQGDFINKTTANRKLALLNKAENILFAKQEADKGNTHESNYMAKGGDFNIEKLTPYIDNIGNAILTANTPKIPRPELQKPTNLESTYNVEAQLSSLKDSEKNISKLIMDNTSSSKDARNAIASNKLKYTRERNKILENKENKEIALRNAKALNKQRVDTANINSINKFNLNEVQRKSAIQSRLSKNLSNLAGDIIDKRNFEAAENYSNERLEIMKNLPSNSGVVRRVDLNNRFEVDRLKNNPSALKEAFKEYEGTPEEEEFRRIFNYNPKVGLSGGIKSRPKLATPNYFN